MLHIDVQGRGPALILLHGWGLHGGVFAPLCQQLGAHFTLYNVDLPGHGRSSHLPVPASLDAWATAVLEEVPAGLWLGWSLGGLVAQRAAQLAPAQVRGLVSIASSPCFVRHAGWPHGIEPTVLVGFTRHLQQHYAQTVDRFLALDLMTLPGGQQAATDLRDALLAVGRRVMPPWPPAASCCCTVTCASSCPACACPACGWPASATAWSPRQRWPPPRRWHHRHGN